MARQVAHEVKNPLTPIQLSAEHLRRVFARPQRGLRAPRSRPAPTTILKQVRDAARDRDRVLRVRAAAGRRAGARRTRGRWSRRRCAPYQPGLPPGVTLTVDVERRRAAGAGGPPPARARGGEPARERAAGRGRGGRASGSACAPPRADGASRSRSTDSGPGIDPEVERPRLRAVLLDQDERQRPGPGARQEDRRGPRRRVSRSRAAPGRGTRAGPLAARGRVRRPERGSPPANARRDSGGGRERLPVGRHELQALLRMRAARFPAL